MRNGRSGLGLLGSRWISDLRTVGGCILPRLSRVVSVHEVQDPISSPPHHARPPPAVERRGTAEVQAAEGCVEEAAAARRRGWLLSLVI